MYKIKQLENVESKIELSYFKTNWNNRLVLPDL